MLDEISTKYLFRFAYLMNNYRDPWLRQVEKEFGLTRPEVTILFCLGQIDGITAKDVADITRQPKNTLSRGSLVLENKKLIARENDQRDRRRSILNITEKGRQICDRVVESYQQIEHNMISPLNRKDLQDLDRILKKMCKRVADQNGSPLS